MSDANRDATIAARTHFDVHDRTARTAMAERLGVTDERLRKAVTMVGSRVSSVAAYLKK